LFLHLTNRYTWWDSISISKPKPAGFTF